MGNATTGLGRLRSSPAAVLALVLVVAVAARLLALAPFLDVRTPQGDETYYLACAKSILAGNGHPGSVRAPLYPAFIAAVFSLFGPNWLALQLVQIALSLLPVTCVFLMVRPRFGTAAAGLSGVAVALTPSLAHYPHFFWSESLVCALVMAFFLAFERHERTGSLPMLALSGLLLGAAALARETWALFALPAAGLLVLAGRDPLRTRALRALLFLACVFSVVLPWTARNYREHGQFVLVSTNRWYPLAIGNLTAPDGSDAKTEELTKPHRVASKEMGELEAEVYWREVALGAIRAEQPTWFFDKLVRNVPKMFSLRSQPVRYLRNGWMPRPDPLAGRLLVWYDALAYLALTVLGLLGFWWAPGGLLKWMLALAVVFTFAVHVAANATARFLVPLMPILVLYTGPLFTGREEAPPAWRRAGGLLTAAAFLAMTLGGWRAIARVLELF